ncbi:PIR protein [Plasmodium vivax]|uniref:VIR protein n=1 Tax=Plasmodium vivax TaxID=5855 RepID=A0A565A0G9_PLAVI|nr:PIR protein [Plasmodium vivax]
MIDTENDDTYFKYNDYAKIKGKFLSKLRYNNDYNEEFFERALSELKAESGHEITFSKIFIELQKHLNQDGILGYEDTHNGCKYINYVLNKDFTGINLNINYEKTFKLFKQFEDKFRSEKRRRGHICDLHYISDEIYKRMDKLYSFYDDFTALNPNNNYNPKCEDLSKFVILFKDYIWFINDNGSDIIKNNLKDFINVIKQHRWTTNNVCNNELSQIASQKLRFSVKKEEPAPHNPAQTFQIKSVSSPDPQSVIGDQRLPHTNGLEPSEEQPAETLPHTGSLPYTERQDNSETPHTREKLQPREVQKSTDLVLPNRDQSILEAESPQQEEYARNVFPFRRQHYPDAPVHHEVLGSQYMENETLENKGYLRTVRDAVSGFMEGVDPVPVVGVSGGMGALFLLFRYTPVGAFNGPFPGGFPGFEEYESGYIGYGPMNPLAE